jgi:pyruvate dehydrogenase E1 component alpha subunit
MMQKTHREEGKIPRLLRPQARLTGDPGAAMTGLAEEIPKPGQIRRDGEMTLTEMSAVTDAARESRAGELTDEDRARLFRFMAMMRAAEERGLALYKQGKVPGSFYDGCGQEAISVGAAYALGPRDRMCILHRDLGAHFVRGVTPDRYLANYMGRAGGVTGGRDGNMHFGDRRLGCIGMVSMLPDMAQPAVGMALAFKMRGEARVAMTFFGEGSTANGQWHEAMNFAGIHRLPVVFVLENNQFAYSTPNSLEFAVDPVKRAEGYGFPGVKVDGNDVEAVFSAASGAADRARDGGGPTLIECETMRMHGHGAHDDMSYVPPEMREHWRVRDPIERYAERLIADYGFQRDEVAAIREEVRRYVDECAQKALVSPMPEPEHALEGVFADRFEPLGDGQAPWSRWSAKAARSGNGRSA